MRATLTRMHRAHYAVVQQRFAQAKPAIENGAAGDDSDDDDAPLVRRDKGKGRA